ALLRATFDSWGAHKAPRMGAALAYYTALSLAPLVVIVVGLVGTVMKHEAARQQVVAQFSELVGKAGGETVETILAHSTSQDGGWWAALLGVVTLLIGASGVFIELQDSLNEIWEAPPRVWNWRGLVHDRLLSLAMVFGLGFIVLVSLLASAGIAAISGYM